MKHTCCWSIALISVALIFLVGCEEDSSNEDPVGLDISGEWSGRYYLEGSGKETPITATITQNGRSLFVETSLPGPQHFFTGELRKSGYVFLTDADDGETWTSGGISETHVKFIDYAFGPGTPLQVVDLRR